MLCFLYFVFNTIGGLGLQTFIPTVLQLGFDVGLMLATSTLTAYLLGGTAGILAGGFLAARTARHDRVAAAGMALGAAVLAVVAAAGITPALLLPVFALVGFALGTTGPSRDLIVRGATPKGAAGRVYGFVYSGLDLGGIIGPVALGVLLDHGHPREVFYRRRSLLRGRNRHRVSRAPCVVRAGRARPGDLRCTAPTLTAFAAPRGAHSALRAAVRALTMDLGIAGKRALVCAASRGLGRGCAQALAEAGCDVTIVARTEDVLRRTAGEIGACTGRAVHWVACDITTPEGRAAALAACPEPDILINNAGGPPPGDFRDWDRAAWIRALDANMLTPIELIKATVDAMIARKFGRIVNITSSAVKAPIDILGLSNGARSGLTGFVAGLARKVAAHNVTINNLLPGSFDTDRLRTTMEGRARAGGKSLAEVLRAGAAAVPAGRFGQPDEFGAVCAFLCSVHAGYIVGQNILQDGGAYPGTF